MDIKKLTLNNLGRFDNLEVDVAPTPDYPSNVTIFIGNNGAGKTSILEALEVFSSKRMYKNQFRIYCNSSTIYCKYQINNKDIFNNLEQQQYLLPLKFQEAFRSGEFNEITLKITRSCFRIFG